MAYHPYLYFDGNCREAMTRYQELMGGELSLMTGADAPPGEAPDGMGDKIMHAALVNGDDLLMASDSFDDDFPQVQGMYVHYATSDVEQARSVFEGLAEGGTVEMPGGEVFWSPYFGVVRDRFGTPWQVGAEPPAD